MPTLNNDTVSKLPLAAAGQYIERDDKLPGFFTQAVEIYFRQLLQVAQQFAVFFGFRQLACNIDNMLHKEFNSLELIRQAVRLRIAGLLVHLELL